MNGPNETTTGTAGEQVIGVTELVQILSDKTGIGVIICNPLGRLQSVNNKILAMTDFPRELLLNLSIADIFREKRTAVGILQLLQRQIGPSVVVERQLIHRDGNLLTVEVNGRRLNDANFFLLVRDISDRHFTEEILASQNRILEMIAAGALLQETLHFLAEFTEAQSSDMLVSILLIDETGQRLTHGAAPSLPDEYIQAIDGVRIGDAVGSCGTAAWRKEEVIVDDIATDPLWSEFSHLALKHNLRACWSTPILNAGGRVLGTFAVYFRSRARPTIVQKRMIALATYTAAIAISRHQEEQTLRRSEAMLRVAQNRARLGYWNLDVATGVMNWSEVLYSIFGLNSLDYSPTIDSLYRDLILPADVDRLKQRQADAFLDPSLTIQLDVRGVRSNGEIRWLHLDGIATVNIQSEPVSMHGTIQDITERKQAEDERERLQSQLVQAQKLESIGRLAGGVAHDFNNILVVIQNYAELISWKVHDDELLHGYSREIKRAVNRASALVRQLLTFARKQAVAPIVLNMSTCVQELLLMLRSLVGSGIEIEYVGSSMVCHVKMDPTQIDQIVTNLVANAKDAITEVGKIVIQTECVSVTFEEIPQDFTCKPGKFVKLSVSDTGSGIEQETQRHLFEPFFSTKAVGKGTGLGLSTVYGIATQNLGFVKVHSQLNVGTMFEVFLPQHETETQEPEANSKLLSSVS